MIDKRESRVFKANETQKKANNLPLKDGHVYCFITTEKTVYQPGSSLMRKKGGPTLADLARKAGVSISTVSRCLNNQGQISSGTRQRILRLARENPAMNSSVQTILLILPPGQDFGWYTFYLLQELRKVGTDRKVTLEIQFADHCSHLQERNFGGIISVDYSNHLEKLLGANHTIPLVCLNNPGNSLERVYSICSNDHQGMREALIYLIEHNHRKIALLLHHNDRSITAQNREQALREIMAEFKLTNQVVVARYINDPIGCVDMLHKSGVTALISPAESSSLKLLKAFHTVKCKIPKEMSLITGEISYISGCLQPALSTLEQDFGKLATCAFDTIEKLQRGETVPLLQKIDYRLNKRDSVALSPDTAELLE